MSTNRYPNVVRVYTTSQAPNYDLPWQADMSERSTGSGVVIAGQRILTGAHVVADATFLQVQKPSDPKKYVAEIVSVCHDADLALLTVKEPEFFDRQTKPAQLGGLVGRHQTVSVVGFPVGGDEISVTQGVVSRLEVQTYDHSQRNLLAVTVDAAINEGNSGGPVFLNSKLVGIAFQKLDGADNIGEVVPVPVIKAFLRQAKTRLAVQMPAIGAFTQNLENPVLRKTLGLKKDESGILVNAVDYESSADGKLKPGDVLLEVDDRSISNNGTINYRNSYRMRYDVGLSELAVGDTLTFKVLRDRRRRQVSLTLSPPAFLVPRSRYDVSPSFLVFAGLAFQPLSRNFLECWERWWDRAPSKLLSLYHNGVRTKARQQVVVLSQILADEVNVGYEVLEYEILHEVNGKAIRNLTHLAEVLASLKGGQVDFRTLAGSRMVVDAKAARAAAARIADRYRVAAERSLDLPPF